MNERLETMRKAIVLYQTHKPVNGADLDILLDFLERQIKLIRSGL